jgi:uncharacterized membrane protein
LTIVISSPPPRSYRSAMATPTSRIAGRTLERIAALSDGLFAVAMTLLVLDLAVPAATAVRSETALWDALAALWPHLLMYLISFITLGIFWSGQRLQLEHFARGDRNLAWHHIAFLAAVALIAFSTKLLAEHMALRTAFLVYWANLLIVDAILFRSWRYATATGLVRRTTSVAVRAAIEQRIVVAQGLYAAAAALCAVNTYWSVAFLALAQLGLAIAPRLSWLVPR